MKNLNQKDLFTGLAIGAFILVSLAFIGKKKTPTAPAAITPTQSECEQKWKDKARMIKVASPEALQRMKAEFIADCMNP